jgi:hypothetical protein
MAQRCLTAAVAVMLACGGARADDWLARYNVAWHTPSKDSLDSMPLSGRLGAGANVWVQDGAIWLYLAHSGAFDEQGRLLKLGCVRIGHDRRPGDALGTRARRQGQAESLPRLAGGVGR